MTGCFVRGIKPETCFSWPSEPFPYVTKRYFRSLPGGPYHKFNYLQISLSHYNLGTGKRFPADTLGHSNWKWMKEKGDRNQIDESQGTAEYQRKLCSSKLKSGTFNYSLWVNNVPTNQSTHTHWCMYLVTYGFFLYSRNEAVASKSCPAILY